MKIDGLRSPRDRVGDLVHFGRMLDKIRLRQRGALPASHDANLGKGFDGRVCALLGVAYEDVIARVKLGGDDEEILQWCYDNGRKPAPEEIEMFNAFLTKRGWRDKASDALASAKKRDGLTGRHDIHTFFDLIDADEGRL